MSVRMCICRNKINKKKEDNIYTLKPPKYTKSIELREMSYTEHIIASTQRAIFFSCVCFECNILSRPFSKSLDEFYLAQKISPFVFFRPKDARKYKNTLVSYSTEESPTIWIQSRNSVSQSIFYDIKRKWGVGIKQNV